MSETTAQLNSEVNWEALGLIDTALGATAVRELMSTAEVTDILLDIRSALFDELQTI